MRKALADDGEQLIRAARTVVSSITDLEELFPGETGPLLAEQQRETIVSSLATESFFERIPDVRSTLRSIAENLAHRYAELRQQYQEERADARKHLESLDEWVAPTDEDQKDIAGRLTTTDIPAEPRPTRELADLRLLLTRRSGLAAMMDTLQHEVVKRVPQKPPELVAESQDGTPSVVEVSVRDILPSQSFKSPPDLELWIIGLREWLLPLLDKHQEIRFKE